MASKPSIPKGTRDFSPVEVSKRNYIIAIMRTHFENYGYQPIETPSFENSDTLMGKYGEEGDRLIFKILNSGDYLDKVSSEELQTINYKQLTSKISEKALRYDLTVPFARYVVQHQSEIEFPFKRYQIQPVWRADRPQKGRFREFYQCDADVVGSTSLWQEVELVQLYDAVFADLGLDGVTIKINNRKVLSGIAEVIGASDKLIDFTVALDKLDKIGEDGVKKEMLEKGISEEALVKVQPLFNFTGTIQEKIAKLSILLSSSDEGMKGVEELRFICDNVTKLGLQKATLDLDVTLARGLNYYTGAIFEVAAPEGVAMGSIGGGGRYDDLTGIFGLKNMSGVGISFGLDRIYLVLEELGLFPETVTTSTKVMFLNFGETQSFEVMQAVQKLRSINIKTEMYPDAVKIDKQFKHAERRGIPFVVKEISNGLYTLKNIISGEQVQVSFEELLTKIN
ncbi:MAG: histidine--tRNA ligase [Flavobacterium sp.]